MRRLLMAVDTKYKRLEYIQSTGTQYIDTGILANDETGMQVDAQYLFTNTDAVVIGSRVSSASYSRCFIGLSDLGFYYGWNNLLGNRPTANINRNILSLNLYNNRKTYFNGNIVNDNISETLTTQTKNICLFASGDGSVSSGVNFFSTVKMYSAQITQGTTLVRNFIPVLRKSDNEIGMLDLVEGKFYGNAGTGKFTANLDTMYALIQGTPTVQDGRVSGFSTSNYLKTNVIFDNAKAIQNCEIQCKFKFEPNTFASTSTEQQVLGAYFRGESDGIRVTGNGRVRWFILGSQLMLQTDANYLQANLNYIARGIINNGLAKLYIGTSENNLEEVASASIPTEYTLGMQRKITIGVATNTANPFQSSIDLNRSYIKIDDTKYNLQAVVGYTVVGSPTITDGVVSGFTTSDYLTLGARTLNLENIVFHTKFKTGILQSNVTYTIFMFGNYGSAYPIGFLIQNKRFRLFYAGNANSGNVNTATTYFLDDNTEYEVEFGTKNSKRYCKFGLAGNMTDFTLNSGNDTDFVGSVQKWIWLGVVGTNYDWAFTVGSIDLNSTYIKINNKLWFNGLEQ